MRLAADDFDGAAVATLAQRLGAALSRKAAASDYDARAH